MLAQWTDSKSSYSREINSAAEAADLIKELRSSTLEPSMVQFRDDSVGLCFGYGTGREKAVLTFQYTLDPPYYTSLADTPSPHMRFWYAQEYTEYPGWNMISHEDAEQALREFFVTKQLPSCIRWEKL